MIPSSRFRILGLAALAVLNPFAIGMVRGQAANAKRDHFESKIRPVLVEHCYSCHSVEAEEVEGGLMLDNRAAIARGGQSGKVLVPGNPEASLLMRVLRHPKDGVQMPPDDKLPDRVIADFEQWIRDGAVDPRDGTAPKLPNQIFATAKTHWAFQAPRKADVPSVESAWPRDDIDRLILARLRETGLSPSSDASRAVWFRRVHFDLVGLPPTFAQMQSFQSDSSDQAFERVVDRLLDSPRFGERWARHWLDLARFGDTKGYVFTQGREYPNAYKYRDWVIAAFNRDLPYDEFLKYQLAADLLISPDQENVSDLAALGYVTLGRRFLNNKHDIIDDRIDVVSRGLMGLTVTCARCHDHKYDPIRSRDYYGLYGVFASSDEQQDEGLPLRLKEGKIRDVRVFLRGKPGNFGEQAPRRFPEFFAPENPPFQHGSGRLELAKIIADPQNPLTARVFVNRAWGHLFGEPLVSTPSDFGLRTSSPPQQDVLDHLAVGFVEDGWSVKRLLRRLVLSSTYRQQSHDRDECLALDPENRLLWKTNRRRLNFEAMRDAMLSVAGILDSNVGGPSVKIEASPSPPKRTLYAYIDRQNLPGLFRTFDFASPDTHSPQRPFTTSPQQSLFLMNNAFSQRIAGSLVQRLEGEDDGARLRRVYQIVFAREPEADELKLGLEFFKQSGTNSAGKTSPWTFGYGRYDEKDGTRFTPLPHFTGTAWQGGAELPDPKLGWVTLRVNGGHPGDAVHAAIRRWTAPADGEVRFEGTLTHPAEQGDGVQGRMVLAGKTSLGEWIAKHSTVETKPASLSVTAGQTVDWIVDSRDSVNFDSFQWRGRVVFRRNTNREDEEWTFADPLRIDRIDPWALYAQTLMLTNEFHFLD